VNDRKRRAACAGKPIMSNNVRDNLARRRVELDLDGAHPI
jgi:hypothetical protein